MSKIFSKNLRKYRELAGFKQAKDFANVLGMRYTTYISYENQDREPKYEILCQIADLLHISTDELLGRVVKNNEKESFEQWKRRLQGYGFEVNDEDRNNIIVSIEEVVPTDEEFGYEEIVRSACFNNPESFVNAMEYTMKQTRRFLGRIKQEKPCFIEYFRDNCSGKIYEEDFSQERKLPTTRIIS